MVKVAFIVEGKVEQIFIDLLDQKGWFSKYNIEKIGPTIDVKGGFDIERSSNHINCQSAKYFVDKIKTIGN